MEENRVCYGLNVEYSSQAYMFTYLIPRWFAGVFKDAGIFEHVA